MAGNVENAAQGTAPILREEYLFSAFRRLFSPAASVGVYLDVWASEPV